MADADRTLFYASRPRLRIDGRQVDDLGDVLLHSLLVEESTLGLFRCEASFLNWDSKDGQVGFLFFDNQLLDFGKTIAVEFGPPGAAGPVFAGRISGLEANFPADQEPEFVILAEDRFQDLRMERRTRTFENLSDADVIRQVASQHSLTAQVDLDGPTHRVLAQVNQSDLAFLRERAVAVDAELWLDNRTLYVQTRPRRSPGTATCT
jgi:phage protein D